MYEVIEKRKMLLDGTEITTYTRNVSAPVFLKWKPASQAIEAATVDKYSRNGFEVFLSSDCELEIRIRALKFITKVLEKESNEVYD